MRVSIFLAVVFSLSSLICFSQVDSLMRSLETELGNFSPDTSMPPNDNKTKLASRLLNYSGILNVQEALAFKRMEARNKKEQKEEDIVRAEQFYTTGNGYRWLNNTMINIYRNTFTERELKKLDKFFRKKTGQKFIQSFPLIMMKALVAIQQINDAGGVKL